MGMTTDGPFLSAEQLYMEFPFHAVANPTGASVGGRVMNDRRGTHLVVVDGVSFHLSAGQSLALLGHNGAGKTTLLRMLAGILLPTRGMVRSNGVVGNALATNIGFRPEATGRRNIALRAILNGYKRKDIPSIIADVEAFADLGPFLDAPFHTYSAGMRARLTFGIATAFACDILILDEWIGAGDRQMAVKAADRMRKFVSQAAIVVLASHNTELLKRVATKGLVLEHGRARFFGPIEEAVAFLEEKPAG